MYIDRPIFHTLFEHRMNRKITILLGAWQVGKTSLLQALYKTLQAEETCLFLDLDLYSNYGDWFSSAVLSATFSSRVWA